MKVTVTKYLNVRVGEPSINAPNYQYLVPGCVIEVDGKLYEGEPFHGNTLWYKDKAGNYYWSGGIGTTQQITKRFIEDNFRFDKLPWHITDFGVHEKWKTTRGEGINIAIIDSGCHAHDNFIAQIKSKKNFLNGSTDVKDNIGHGSHVTGIIASNGINNIFGIAPEVNLHIGKVINRDSDGLNPTVIAQAIDHYSDKVDIINISFGLMENHKVIQKAIKNCNALVVAAHGNDKTQKRKQGNYPALNEGCLAVGSFGLTNHKIKLSNQLIRAGGIDLVAPGENILSTYKDGKIDTDSGSSMATAYVSGVLALLKSEQPFRSMQEIKEELLAASSIITEATMNYQKINLPKDHIV